LTRHLEEKPGNAKVAPLHHYMKGGEQVKKAGAAVGVAEKGDVCKEGRYVRADGHADTVPF